MRHKRVKSELSGQVVQGKFERIPKEHSRELKAIGFKWKMVLNEKNERFTVFVKKGVKSTVQSDLLLEPFRLDLRFDFDSKPNSKNPKKLKTNHKTFWANEMIKAVWKETRNHNPLKLSSENHSPLISVDKNCSVLSLNFTSDSFYQSHSHEEWSEALMTSEMNRHVSAVAGEKGKWLRRYQVEFEENRTRVKRALRVAPLWVVGKRPCGKQCYRYSL